MAWSVALSGEGISTLGRFERLGLGLDIPVAQGAFG